MTDSAELPAMEIYRDGFTTWRVLQRHCDDHVVIRKTDGRIAINGVSLPLESPEVAENLALELLAAVQYVRTQED